MIDRDAAFLWETEVLRENSYRSDQAVTGRHQAGPKTGESADEWMTLREAEETTGIPVGTLRNWARRERISSYLDETRSEPRRLVSLRTVIQRAREIGRDIDVRLPAKGGHRQSRSGTQPRSAGPDQRGSETEIESGAAPPGTMIVPVDAWDKMLLQLGNLHEAGRQLAEARERAARAETEALFLRERLAELREARDVAEVAPDSAAESASDENPVEPIESSRMPSFTAYLWRMAASSRHRKRKG